MANIAMLLDSEEGYLFSTFKLARDLESRGHQVCYLGYRGAEELVGKQGFNFMPALGDPPPAPPTEEMPLFPLRPLLGEHVLDGAVESSTFDVFLTLSMFCLEALVLRYRYKTPVILLRNHFDTKSRARFFRHIVVGRLLESAYGAQELAEMLSGAGISIHRLADMAALVVDEMPEIALFPEALGSSEMSSDKKLCYAGLAVDANRLDDSFEWSGIDRNCNRKLIYCSLGSQAHLKIETSCRLFRLLINMVSHRPDLQLILSTGKRIPADDLNPDAQNIYVAEWVPQMEVLRRSDVMIHHGGMASVQECIAAGVPMIICPQVRDQFDSAQKVVELKLGLRGDIGTVSIQDLSSLIHNVVEDPSYRERVRARRESILLTNSAAAAVRVVEEALRR